jgi:hypothetical protein
MSVPSILIVPLFPGGSALGTAATIVSSADAVGAATRAAAPDSSVNAPAAATNAAHAGAATGRWHHEQASIQERDLTSQYASSVASVNYLR